MSWHPECISVVFLTLVLTYTTKAQDDLFISNLSFIDDSLIVEITGDAHSCELGSGDDSLWIRYGSQELASPLLSCQRKVPDLPLFVGISLDRSGSMSEIQFDNKSASTFSAQIAQELVRDLSPFGVKMMIHRFGYEFGVMQTYTASENELLLDIAVNPKVDGTFERADWDANFTDSSAGLAHVVLARGAQSHLVFFTDAVGSFREADRVRSQWKSLGARLHIVFINSWSEKSDVNTQAGRILVEIAESSGGTVTYSGQQTMHHVSRELRSHLLSSCVCVAHYKINACELSTTIQARIGDGEWSPIRMIQIPDHIADSRVDFLEPYVVVNPFDTAFGNASKSVQFTPMAQNVEITGVSVHGNGIRASFVDQSPPFTLEMGDTAQLNVSWDSTFLRSGIATLRIQSPACEQAGVLRISASHPTGRAGWHSVVYPNGGEVFTAGDLISPIWRSGLPENSSIVEVSLDSGDTWVPTAGISEYESNVARLPFIETDDALLRVRSTLSERSQKLFELPFVPFSLDVGSGNSSILVYNTLSERGELIDLWTGELLSDIPGIQRVSGLVDLRFSPDNRYISGSQDRYIWSLDELDINRTLDSFSPRSISEDWSTVFLSNPRHISLQDSADTVYLWEFDSKSPVDSILFTCGRRQLWSADGNLIVTRSCTRDSVQVVNRLTGMKRGIRVFNPGESSNNVEIAFSQNLQSLLIITLSGKERIIHWDYTTDSILVEVPTKEVVGVKDGDILFDGRIVLYGQDDVYVFDPSDSSITTFPSPTRIVSYALADNHRFVVTGDEAGGVWIHKLSDQPYSQDVSDSTWSIRIPQLSAPEIYLGEVELGDHLLATVSVVYNVGEVDFRVDSAWFAFSGVPPEFEVESIGIGPVRPQDSATGVISFRAQQPGRRQGSLLVRYQGSRNILVSISADVIPPTVDVLQHDTLLSGIVLRGQSCDTALPILRNISARPLYLDSVRIEGRDSGSWSIISFNAGFLSPGETCLQSIEFLPRSVGVHRANLAYYFSHLYSPVRIPLIGVALPDSIHIPDTIIYVGDYVNLPIRANVIRESGESILAEFRALVTYDPTPLQFAPDSLYSQIYTNSAGEAPDTTVSVAGQCLIGVGAQGDVGSPKFLARVSTESTSLAVDSFSWYCLGRVLTVRNTRKGEITIAGAAPGLYLDSAGADSWQVLSGYPNPANQVFVFEISIPDSSPVSVDLFDAVGKNIQSIWSGSTVGGIHRVTIDCSGLASGQYSVRVASGDRSHNYPLLIVH